LLLNKFFFQLSIHGYFNGTGSTMQKIGTAQANFFREVGGAYEYLCRARAVDDVIDRVTQEMR